MPAELCEVIPGQPARKKLAGEQPETMLKVSARTPGENAHLVVNEGAEMFGLQTGQTNGPVRLIYFLFAAGHEKWLMC